MSRTRYALALALLLAPLALHPGCSDRSRHPWPSASAAGGPWLWTPAHGGFPTGERMVRMDSPGGIEAWVPEAWERAVPEKFARYLAMLDSEPNEKGLEAWRAAGGVGDPPPGAVKTLHDTPGRLRVVFVPQVQLLRVGPASFAAGVTQTVGGVTTAYLCWPPNVGDQVAQDAWIRDLVRHEGSHAAGNWPGSHPATCPDCMAWGL